MLFNLEFRSVSFSVCTSCRRAQKSTLRAGRGTVRHAIACKDKKGFEKYASLCLQGVKINEKSSVSVDPISLILFQYLVNLPFCQLAILSTCHFVTLPLCQLATLSTCHLVNLPLCQLAILSINIPKIIYLTQQISCLAKPIFITSD